MISRGIIPSSLPFFSIRIIYLYTQPFSPSMQSKWYIFLLHWYYEELFDLLWKVCCLKGQGARSKERFRHTSMACLGLWHFTQLPWEGCFFFYCCSITVVLIPPPSLSPWPIHLHLPQSVFPVSPLPLSLSMGPLYKFLDDPSLLSPIIPLSHPLWSLSVCSSFSCLWFCFACCFVDQIPLIGEITQYLSFTVWIFFT